MQILRAQPRVLRLMHLRLLDQMPRKCRVSHRNNRDLVPVSWSATKLISPSILIMDDRVLGDVAIVRVSIPDLLFRLSRGAPDQAAATRLTLHLLGDSDDARALSCDYLRRRISAGTRAAGPAARTAGPSVAIK